MAKSEEEAFCCTEAPKHVVTCNKYHEIEIRPQLVKRLLLRVKIVIFITILARYLDSFSGYLEIFCGYLGRFLSISVNIFRPFFEIFVSKPIFDLCYSKNVANRCMRFVIQPVDYENAFDSVWQSILGDPGATSWSDGIFTGESLQQERESPWAFRPGSNVELYMCRT